tara:strand:+ start:78 stop:581 length:504 start_codon:yes stop_codon:yes gene_type:complete
MVRLRRAILWAMAIGLLNVSCVVFHPEQFRTDELGYYINHYNACGPVALEKAFEALGDNDASRVDLSREIQDEGNALRHFVSLLHYDGLLITLPNELKTICKKHGYEVTEIHSLDELNLKEDIALVLVWGEILKREAHWLVFPIDTKIKDWYGGYTRIGKILLLKKI